MIARLLFGLIIMSSLFIARPVVAQSPYFGEYVDHAKFVELSPKEQRDFLVALMQTVADLEQKAIQSGQHLAPSDKRKTVQQLHWDKVKKALQRFQQLVAVSSAYADAVPSYDQTCFSPGQISAAAVLENGAPASCLFGSYRSTYVRSGTQQYCQRPGCSKNEAIRLEYARVASQGRCSKNQMACNPALFGYDKSGIAGQKPTCVQIDINVNGNITNTVQNASLACLIAVTNDETKEKRLDDIALQIKNNADTAREFSKLLHTVTNLCICEGSVGDNAEVPAYLREMSNTYSKYVRDHRTCNALLAQTSEVLKRVSIGGGCIAEILPGNVTKLSEDLGYINNYSSRFLLLARGTSAVPTGRLTQRDIHAAMARYSDRWVVDDSFTRTSDNAGRAIQQNDITRVSSEGALDEVASYMQAGAALKARTGDVNKWCPLNFPDPQVSPAVTCTISAASSTRGADSKVTVAATVALSTLPPGVTSTGISWKANGVAVTGQTAATLAAQNIEGVAAEAITVPIEATHTLSRGGPVVCSGTANFPANTTACTISETVTYDGANAKIAITVDKNASIWPADRPMEVKSGENAATAGADGSYEIIVPRSQASVVVSATAVAARGGAALTCSKTVTLTADDSPCEISFGETSPVENGNKLSASVSLPPRITGATAITWIPAQATPSTDTTVTLLFDKPAVGDDQEIVARATVTTATGTVSCEGKKTLAATVAATAGCILNVTAVAGEAGKYSLSASLSEATGTKAPADGTPPSYTGAGITFAVANNIGMASVDSAATVATKEITATYTGKDGKNYSCKFNVTIPGRAPAAGGGGGVPQQQGPMVIPPAGQSLFKPGLR